MLNTEKRNPKTTHIDKMETCDILTVMNAENRLVNDAIDLVIPQICLAVDAIVHAFETGGRLFYIGAGTSGRLAVTDAAECPPTFGVDRALVTGIIAGGEKSMTQAAEAEEDRADMGAADLLAHHIHPNDVVVGLSAAGNAAYVAGALRCAKQNGCTTIGIFCNAGTLLDEISDIPICVDTGPEVITGSTRLKAGTAQKLVLNMLSTASMIKTGKVYENLMINLKPVNQKLKNRCIRIISEITGANSEACAHALDQTGGNVRQAIQWMKERG